MSFVVPHETKGWGRSWWNHRTSDKNHPTACSPAPSPHPHLSINHQSDHPFDHPFDRPSDYPPVHLPGHPTPTLLSNLISCSLLATTKSPNPQIPFCIISLGNYRSLLVANHVTRTINTWSISFTRRTMAYARCTIRMDSGWSGRGEKAINSILYLWFFCINWSP